jgi:hypothetical protein
METQTKTPAASVVEHYATVAPREFSSEIERTWSALEAIKENVTGLVEREVMTPLQAVGILACSSGQLLGYTAFHGEPTLADLIRRENGRRN